MPVNVSPTSDAPPELDRAEAAVLPEPGEQPAATARPDSAAAADDLIAQLAEKQIDALIDEAEARPEPGPPDTDAAVELAMQAAQELSKIANDLGRATDHLLSADLDPDPADEAEATSQSDSADTASDAPSETPPEAAAFDPAADLQVEIAEKAAADRAAAELLAAEEQAARDAALAAQAAAEQAAAEAAKTATVTEASEPEEASAATSTPPSFNPPPHADIDRAHRAADAAESADGRADQQAMAAAFEDNAAAVARELAEDVHPLAATSSSARPAQALPSGVWWRVGLRHASRVPAVCLQILNLPAAAMTDTGREVMGAIAIVTLVNAMSLLLYLMVFG